MINVKRVVNNPLQENTFIISKNNSCLVVDPGDEANKIINAIGDFKVEGILLTHGHYDHISGVNKLYEKFNCPVYIHEDEKEFLTDISLNLASYFVKNYEFKAKEVITFTEGNLSINEFNLDVLHTPGHTCGSSCFLIDNHLFSGDTLFAGTHGRTDLPTSNNNQMKQSLKYLLTLKPDTIVHPGHNEDTTIQREKNTFRF